MDETEKIMQLKGEKVPEELKGVGGEKFRSPPATLLSRATSVNYFCRS